MPQKILVKRGLKQNLPVLSNGEIGLCIDTNEVFIGNNGNQKVSLDNGVKSQISEMENNLLSQIENMFTMLDDYEKYVVNGDWIPAINRAISDVSVKGGTVLFTNIYSCKPSGINFIELKDNVTLKAHTNGKHGIKIVDNSGSFLGLFDNPRWKISNVVIDGLLFDMNYQSNTVAITDGTSNNQQFVINFRQFNNVKIVNNVFKSCGTNVIATTSDSKGLSIKDNTFYWGKHPLSSFYDNSVIYIEALDYLIKDNKFYSLDIHGNGAIELHGGMGIAENNIINDFQAGVNIQSAYIPATNENNFIVRGNIINRCLTGVRFWTMPNIELKNVVVANNIIKLNQVTKNEVNFFTGISFAYRSDNAKSRNITITGNVIEFENEPSNGRVINFPQLSGGINLKKYNTLSNVIISNNTIINSPTMGISLALYDTPDKLDNVIAKDNLIINSGTNILCPSAYRSSIFLEWATIRNTIIKDNISVGDKVINHSYIGGGVNADATLKMD